MNQFGRFAALGCAAMVVFLAGCTKNENVPVTGVSVIPSSLTLGIGESQTLTADVQPADATNKGVTWSSDDPTMNVIALSGNIVKGLAEGTATVTVTTDDGGRTATCMITVSGSKIPVQGVSLSPSGSASLSAGQTLTVTATVTPSNATEANNIYWTSSDTKVATVSGSGASATVTAVAAGSASITCSVDGKTATLSVTVTGGGDNPPAQTAPEGTVDLGLPSGIFWCEKPLGADEGHPYGQNYMWTDNNVQDKYNQTDGLTLLEAADDHATQLLGADYRTPTMGDWVELLSNCTWEQAKQGDVEGCLLTSKKNGNTLFIKLNNYWTSTIKHFVHSSGVYRYANAVSFVNENGVLQVKNVVKERESSLNVIPVYAKRPVEASGISVPQEKVEMVRGETVKLTASVQPSSASQYVYWGDSGTGFVTHFYTGEAKLAGLGNSVGRVRAYDGTNGYESSYVYLYPKFPKKPAEAVDLGLPSGTKWASYDLGASAPEEPGLFFAWGETEQKYAYDSESYKWYNAANKTYTKYGPEDRYLEAKDDAAAVNWGGAWRMPTLDQVQELVNKTTMVETTLNGVAGRMVTGPNLKTIFLPYGGYRAGSNSVYQEKQFCYATCELNKSGETMVFLSDDNTNTLYREIGCCIRPVQPKQ